MSNLILIAGGTGQGKSRLTNQDILKNEIRKINGKDRYFISVNSKRQYIFDLNNEYEFPVDFDGTPRPIKRHTACNYSQFIANCKKLQKTNIVFEDASGFLRGKQGKEIIQLIVQRRHVQNNWIILFHSINRIPPELMEYCNYLIIFKTGDNLKDIDNKFKNPVINSMFIEIQKRKDHSYINKKML